MTILSLFCHGNIELLMYSDQDPKEYIRDLMKIGKEK